MGEGNETGQQNLVERIASSDITPEYVAALTLDGIEVVRAFSVYPELEQLRPTSMEPIPPEITESFVNQHIGDILEVATLFSITRLALSGINEVVKKTTKKEIPDEACFWASMIVGVTIPTLMESNVISLLGQKLNPHADFPDFFGIGVAACILTITHYRKEILTFLSRRIGKQKKDTKVLPPNVNII